MNIKRFTKKTFETRVVVKSKEISAEEVNPFKDLLKKKLSVPITLYHL